MTWADQSAGEQASKVSAILVDTGTTLDDLVDDLEARITAARAGYLDYLQRLDHLATDGLSGVANSLAYRVGEIERHFHSYERWYELAAAPSGGTHVADRIGTGGGPFQIDAGNNDWGSWVQILGSSDTPADVGGVKFDLHEVQMTGNERAADYFLQIGFGASGAAALSAGTYTEKALTFDGLNVEKFFVIQSRRQAAGTLAWARCKCPGQNTATLDFYLGLHEYEG